MTKKQNKTFAQRAKDIVKRYSRADFDQIEKAALDSKLESLKQEQESHRQANQMDEYACGGKMYYNGGTTGNGFRTVAHPRNTNTLYPTTDDHNTLISKPYSMYPVAQEFNQEPTTFGYTPQKSNIVDKNNVDNVSNINAVKASPSKSIKGSSANKMYPQLVQAPNMSSVNYEDPYFTQGEALTGANINQYTPKGVDPYQDVVDEPTSDVSTSPYKTSIAPSLISGATSVLGNLYLAGQQKGVDDVKLPRVSAPKVSLERSRQLAKREAIKAGQKAKYITKKGARTSAEYAANRAAIQAGISGKLGETLSASQEKEDLVNTNMKAGMDKYNAELAAKEQMINNANKIRNKSEREAYIAAAIGTVPQMTRDISATRAQDRLINVLGDDYGWYMEKDPNAKWYKRKKSPAIKLRK
jgi:hypothetical protein